MYMTTEENMLTMDEVAELLNVSRQTVRQLVITKQLRSYKVQTVYRIKRDDVDAYLKRKEV
jgi:excisionase family DNA binding protein